MSVCIRRSLCQCLVLLFFLGSQSSHYQGPSMMRRQLNAVGSKVLAESFAKCVDDHAGDPAVVRTWGDNVISICNLTSTICHKPPPPSATTPLILQSFRPRDWMLPLWICNVYLSSSVSLAPRLHPIQTLDTTHHLHTLISITPNA